MTFSLGRPLTAPSARPRNSRGIELSFAPPDGGSDSLQIYGRSDSKEVGPDWYNAFAAWWDRHGYYPSQAGQNGESGDVTLDLVIKRNGDVQSVALADRSGSQWLDMAALAVFRGARLPALPTDAAPTVPLHLTIHYVIIRR